ncbi:MAG: PKD domain-containing protein [Fimbriimonadaceae bacterium]|nr:PKD domain-containing protein [Chitinophagales bacterium]
MQKNLLLSAVLFLTAHNLFAQTIVFEDDFESGSGNWASYEDWDVTDEYAFSGSYSLTESPDDDTYEATIEQITTMIPTVDLTLTLDADVKFKAMLDLEEGFDFTYLEVSIDAGSTWTTVATFNGEDMFEWTEYIIPLGGFVGHPEVKLRFRFDPDDFVEYDGMYIDDIVITKYNIDNSPPLILHDALILNEGTLEENNLNADIIDISGIASAELFYSVDGSAYTSVDGINTAFDNYLFTVPEQEPGAFVDYYITATDDYGSPNTAVSDTFTYISGNYVSYDDATVDFVYDVGELTFREEVAVKFTFEGETDLVAAVIRNYTDPGKLNDSITIHVWEDDGGYPGDDLITPFTLYPEATFSAPYIGTKIDLRPYADVLSGIEGDVFIGYSCDSVAWLTYTSTGLLNRSYYSSSGYWYEFVGDFHFRAITSEIEGAPVANFMYDLAGEPVVEFTDLSTSSPDDWYWDFGDGVTSSATDPVHEYLSNGTFNVCLTVTNDVGEDSYCEIITIDSYLPPDAEFSFFGDPVVSFNDASANDPSSWYWIFDDDETSTEQNPVHTYAANGEYYVCLTAYNVTGSDSKCYLVTIDGYEVTPVTDFTYEVNDNVASFTDLSLNTPTEWNWVFGDGASSDLQNPIHFYDDEGDYEVCLTTANGAGENTMCKTIQVVVDIEDAASMGITIFPNPANDFIQLQFVETVSEKNISIYNSTGVLMQEMNNNTQVLFIDVKKYPEGIYYIYIQYGNTNGIATVSINH